MGASPHTPDLFPEHIERAIAESGCGVGNPVTLVYNLAFQLSASDLG